MRWFPDWPEKYSITIRPALQIIGNTGRCQKVAGMYIMVTEKGIFADTTINVNPTADDLAEITVLTAWAITTI